MQATVIGAGNGEGWLNRRTGMFIVLLLTAADCNFVTSIWSEFWRCHC